MTQNDKVMYHINQYGSITPLEALTRYGIMRLASALMIYVTKGFVLCLT